jgi:hypothetical protein
MGKIFTKKKNYCNKERYIQTKYGKKGKIPNNRCYQSEKYHFGFGFNIMSISQY